MAMKRVVPLNYVTAESCRCQGLKCDGRSSLHHHNDRLYCAFKQISRLVKGAVHYIERWLMTLSSLLDIAFKCLSWMSTTSNAVSVKIFYNFIIIHHLLSDGAMFSRSLISRCIFYPHFFLQPVMTQALSQSSSLWGYLLCAAPLTLSYVSCSTLIRVHWPPCWREDQRIGGWQAKQMGRWKKVFAGDFNSFRFSMFVVVPRECRGGGLKIIKKLKVSGHWSGWWSLESHWCWDWSNKPSRWGQD